jgi:hypothetical protein
LYGRQERYTQLWWGDLRGKDYLGRPRHRWEDSIKMDLEKVAQFMSGTGGRRLLGNMVLNLMVP